MIVVLCQPSSPRFNLLFFYSNHSPYLHCTIPVHLCMVAGYRQPALHTYSIFAKNLSLDLGFPESSGLQWLQKSVVGTKNKLQHS